MLKVLKVFNICISTPINRSIFIGLKISFYFLNLIISNHLIITPKIYEIFDYQNKLEGNGLNLILLFHLTNF